MNTEGNFTHRLIMNVKNLDLTFRVFTPWKICLATTIILTSVVFGQYGLIAHKNHTIASLATENADLRKNLLVIDDQLAALKDSASDVRLFQREIIKVMKGIDQNYPVSLAHATKSKPSNMENEELRDPNDILTCANESIFKLSSTQENLRFETASLLGKAISIKDLLSKTPSMVPVSEPRISSGFGFRRDPLSHKIKKHHGHDYAARIGDLVFASADGQVERAGQNAELGKYIQIAHEDGYSTLYGHLSVIDVKKGDKIVREQKIGRVGNTGLRCRGAHLHFEIRRNGSSLNPKPYLINMPSPDFS